MRDSRLDRGSKCLAHRKGQDGPCQNSAMACQVHCGAALRGKRKGSYCPGAPCKGSKRCRMHGGKSPKGIGSPSFKHGGFSRALPANLQRRYLEVMADDDLLSRRSSVAILRLRTEELVGKLGSGETGALWLRLQKTWRRFKALSGAGNREVAAQVEAEIDGIVEAAGETAAGWQELVKALEAEDRAAALEWRRLVDLKQMISAESALSLFSAVATAVRVNVTNLVPAEYRAPVLRAISRDLSLLLEKPETVSGGGV